MSKPVAGSKAVPSPQPNTSQVYVTALALKENIELLTGQRGNPDSRVITVGELVRLGVITKEQAASL